MHTTTTSRTRVGDLKARNERRCRRILATSAPLRTDDLDWNSVPAVAIDPHVVECLIYMRDVEGFTDRDVIGLTAHRTTLSDPIIAPFLERWRAEEAGHTAALDKFLRAYQTRGHHIPARQQPPPAVARPLERIVARTGGPVGQLVTAAHMTWGAANELLTLNGYRLLAARCGHPTLAVLLRRIAAQEARHYSFYMLQAEWRLTASRLARTVLPRILRRSWTPVGVGDGYKHPTEFAQVLAYLSNGTDGQQAIDRMDARFSALPGLASLEIYRRAASLWDEIHASSRQAAGNEH